MFCPNCGREVANGSSFCSACGTAMGNQASPMGNQASPMGNQTSYMGDQTSYTGNQMQYSNGNYGTPSPDSFSSAPSVSPKEKYKFWGFLIACCLFLVLLFNNFTGIKGAWKFDYEMDGEERYDYNEAENGYRGYEFDNDFITIINDDYRGKETYYVDNGYLHVESDRIKIKCNGFSLKLIEDDDVLVLKRVWEVEFVAKLFVITGLVALFALLSFKSFRKMRS